MTWSKVPGALSAMMLWVSAVGQSSERKELRAAAHARRQRQLAARTESRRGATTGYGTPIRTQTGSETMEANLSHVLLKPPPALRLSFSSSLSSSSP